MNGTYECGGRRLRGNSAAVRPKITVATVVFNGAATFESALRSVIGQCSAHVEYVVIDGGSTDGTLGLIRGHNQDIDYWLSEPDHGIYDAMNKAMRVAHGDWLLFLGADDELLVRVDQIARSLVDADAIYYGNIEIKGTGRIFGGKFSRYRLMQHNICHQSIFYPRSIYSHKEYDLTVGLLADYKYNIELMGAGAPFVHLPMTISLFNDRGASSGNQPYFEEIKLTTIRKWFGATYYFVKRLRSAVVRVIKGNSR